MNFIDPNGLFTLSLGPSARLPVWILKKLGIDLNGQGASAGFLLQITDKCGNFSPDVGGYASLAGPGESYGLGRVAVNIGAHKGGVAEYAGRGADFNTHWKAIGGSLMLDGNNQFSGATLDIGPGYNFGGAVTQTWTASARGVLSKFFKSLKNDNCDCSN